MNDYADIIRRYLVAQFSSKQESDRACEALSALEAELVEQRVKLAAAEERIERLSHISVRFQPDWELEWEIGPGAEIEFGPEDEGE